MATSVTWTFATIFTQSSENLIQRGYEQLFGLALNLASALPAESEPLGFGKEPAEESRLDGLWYKIYSPKPEALLLLKLALLHTSDTTLNVAMLHVDPIIIYSPPHGSAKLASLFVYVHLWVNDTARFCCLGYMQGSAMERIIQQQGHTWRAVGERSGRLCATNLWQRLADARVEQLKATYAGIPSGTTKIPVSFDGRVTDIKHYNFAQDIEVPQLAGSATISSLFSVLAVENLRATRQVMMQLGDMAALIHLRILPHYRVLGVGNIINTGVNGDVTLYRPPLSLRSALREGTSLKDRRVMVMQNKAMRKLSVWSGDPIPAPRVAPSRDVDTVFITRSFSLLNF